MDSNSLPDLKPEPTPALGHPLFGGSAHWEASGHGRGVDMAL